jgi:hypothetical protein
MYQKFIPYLCEAQPVSGNTPPIIRSLKLHWQPLVFHTWNVVGRVVGERCQALSLTPVRISDVHPIVVSSSLSKQISWQYLDYVITASFQLLPHPSLTNHPIVRYYIECSPSDVSNIRMIYESFWAKKNCRTNISGYRPLHGYRNFNVSRFLLPNIDGTNNKVQNHL